jgi:hypothetical protein
MVREPSKKEEIEWINAKYLSVDPITKRDYYETETFSKLTESISKNGFKEEHPLVVRPDPKKKGHYLIVGGQHRFDAGLKAGIFEFPCIKRGLLSDPIEVIREAHQDNILRCEPDAITEANYMRKIGLLKLKEQGYSQDKIDEMQRKMPIDQIAAELGEDASKVKHRLRLLLLHPVIQRMVSRYYMKTTKGLKISPTIGEELASIKQRLTEQKIVKADLELLNIALKCANERLRLSDVRVIHTEIALKGFQNWKNKEIVVEESNIRCYFCGEEASREKNPWLPFCIEHKLLLTTYKDEVDKILLSKEEELGMVKTLKRSPNIPLHESDPFTHKLRKRTESNFSKDGGD